MRPQICETVVGDTMASLIRARDRVRGADMVELRLDGVRDADPEAALAGRALPAIVTCRPVREGGRFAGSERERLQILRRALECGADFVDVEADADCRPLIEATGGKRVIVSRHDFAGTPQDLSTLLESLDAYGSEVVKLAVTTKTLEDVTRLAAAARGHRGQSSTLLIGMGLAGFVGRVLPDRFNAPWTYAGDAIAPGQVPTHALLDEYRFRSLSPSTGIYGVAGSPVGHSLSPGMHNRAIEDAGIDAVYLPLAASSVNDLMAFAAAFDLKGASITIPFKLDMARRADALDDASRRIGAVNTIRLDNGRVSAINTDVAGFLAPLHGRTMLEGARVAVLGAGGAARAVVVALQSAGARVSVHARRLEQAEQVASLVEGSAGPLPPTRGSWDIIVNATPVGMLPGVDDTPFPSGVFDGRVAYDLIYTPAETRFLREAAAQGCQTIGGLEMLVEQAALQFEWWTGHAADRRTFRRAAESRLTSGSVATRS
jgi:3-dehydroquinate dehydratase/shikimate dehydrogenase